MTPEGQDNLKGEACLGCKRNDFQWTPYGDEAEYSDGRLSATGNWQAFLAFIQHPAVSPILEAYDFGSSEHEAHHALLLDRDKLEVYVASVRETESFLNEQWPPKRPARILQEESVPKLSIAVQHEKQLRHADIEEIQRRINPTAILTEYAL